MKKHWLIPALTVNVVISKSFIFRDYPVTKSWQTIGVK